MIHAMETGESSDPTATLDSHSEPGAPARLAGSLPSFPATFLAHYTFVRTLGEGSMGTVHLFRQRKLDRLVAVKVVKGDEITGDQIRRLLKEARILAGLDHPNILAVHDVEGEGNQPYLVSEYVEGSTLAQRLKLGPQPTLDEMVIFGIAVLDALAVAHEKEVVHRDLKPDNIFLTRDGRPKIGDFGLAKARFLPSGVSIGQIAGTPAYMSPEQCLGDSTTPSSDLYSMGAILFEMAAGRTPFLGPRLVDYLTQHVSHAPPALRDLRPDLPEAYENVVSRALEKDPARRFATAVEFQQALVDLEVTSRHRSIGTRSLGGSLRPVPVPIDGVTRVTPSIPTVTSLPPSPPPAMDIAGRVMPVTGALMGALALLVTMMERTAPAVVAPPLSMPGLVAGARPASTLAYVPPPVTVPVAPASSPSPSPSIEKVKERDVTKVTGKRSQDPDSRPPAASREPERERAERPAPAPRAPVPPDPAREWLDRGRAALEAGRFTAPRSECAIDFARRARQIDPRSTEAVELEERATRAAEDQVRQVLARGESERGLALAERLVELYPGRKPYVDQVEALRRPAIVGEWRWDVRALVKFACEASILEDGTISLVGGPAGVISNRGTWILADAAERRFVITWRNGSYDTLVLSRDGKRLDGRNSLGLRVNAMRSDP